LDAAEGKEVTTKLFDVATKQPIKVKCKRNPQLRAVILCGLNLGFGNSDIAGLKPKL